MQYGRYQIIKEVGRGSMGVVFQCLDPHIDRQVAVKVLRTDRVENDAFVQRFLKEAKVIGRLTHPNIVSIYDVGEENGMVYIAMEFLEGISLSEAVRGKLHSARETVALGVQLAEALDYAHQKGVVHRDVKPSNIVVQLDGRIKITDFGIAHVDDSTATLQTQAGDIMGTPAYMSPEQVLSRPVDGRSDIFSLGIILYELTTGRRPFGGDSKSLVTVFNDIVEANPPEPAASTTAVPEELSRLIMKALQKDPAQRFQTGRELAEALKVCLEPRVPAQAPAPVSASASASASAPPALELVPRRGGKFGMAVGIASAIVILVGGALFLSSRHQGAPAAPTQTASERDKPNQPAIPAPKIPDAAPAATSAPPASPTPPVAESTQRPPAAVPESRYPAIPGNGAAAPPASGPLRSYLAPRAEPPVTVKSAKAGKNTPASQASPAQERKRDKQLKPTPQDESRFKAPPQAKPAPPLLAPSKTPSDVPRETAKEPVAAAPGQRLAFLKVASSPPGARVFINGAQKGTTPVIVKLDPGQYQLRLSRPGYRDIEREINLERMKEYPVVEILKPVE